MLSSRERAVSSIAGHALIPAKHHKPARPGQDRLEPSWPRAEAAGHLQQGRRMAQALSMLIIYSYW